MERADHACQKAESEAIWKGAPLGREACAR